MSNNMSENVSEFTPETVGDRIFSIPLYQRLYSWETEHVEQLLDDLYDTFLKTKDKPRKYFIGNIVKSGTNITTKRNALIDGQQRITTLWLMGFVLKEYYKEWEKFVKSGELLRLDFTARNEDRDFLKFLSGTNYNSFITDSHSFEINPVMLKAINVVYHFFEKMKFDQRVVFAKYIYEFTQLVEIKLPDSTDLNKYFEIMNNRGVQLEKHEILKARLIEKIYDAEQKKQYAAIWDACSQMNQYIERSFEKNDEQINIKAEISSLIKNNFSEIPKFVTKLTSGENKNEFSFKKIIEDAKIEGKKNESVNQKSILDENFTSIVNFPTFLLHVYKVWKTDLNISLKDKELLTSISFDTNDKDQDNKDVIEYINEVLIMRILFDQYIIKSYKNGLSNLWETRILKIDEEENERKRDFELSTPILAMINASTSIEHWFTPVLKYLRTTKVIKDEKYTKWLENIDNCFATTRYSESHDMIGTANDILNDIENTKPKINIIIDAEYLSNGVSTEHYWFYKLDYCLWKKWTSNNDDHDIPWKSEIKGFQFRSNRSIEHIYPQHPEDENYWDRIDLDKYGNLALISVSSNSEFNRHGFKWKKGQFEDRIAKKWGIESLKLADVYKRNDWNVTECENHQKDMLKVLNEYHSRI